MSRPVRRMGIKLLLAAALAGAAVALCSVGASGDETRAAAQRQEAGGGASAPARPTRQSLLRGLDPLSHRLEEGVLVSDLAEGRRAVLTLDPGLQEHVTSELERFEVPFGSVVAIEPATGRVLAYVSHSSANPGAGDLARDPTPPTASVFKIISAAALVDAGVSPSERVCYHGGFSRLTEADLADSSRDRRCNTLADAVGGSINTIFAKLSTRHLDSATLERYAAAFGFGHALPFDVPTQASPGEIPSSESDRLEFARTSAGFWHMHMSPLHGALIGATFANDGKMPRASMVDRVTDRNGRVVLRHEPEIFRAVIPRHTARAVGEMMELTVTEGTSRRSFHDQQGNAFLPGIRVAGKTGTLSSENPYRGYTWWVGFAPADRPTIAVAALVVNTPRWRIKASYLARETLRWYLVEKPAIEARRERERAQAESEAQAAAQAE